MTLDELIVKLERTSRDWWLGENGEIRRGEEMIANCPWIEADIPTIEGIATTAIWVAADNAQGHIPALRSRLLAACGLDKEGR